MADQRIEKMARVLVDYSVAIQPGERVLIESTTLAEDLVRACYRRVLEAGAHPHILLSLPDQDEILYASGNDEQLDFVPSFNKLAADTFDARIRIYAEANTRALSKVEPAHAARRQKALSAVQSVVFRRAAQGAFKWISTQFPTQAFAIEAEMGWQEYQDFLYAANHCDDCTPDPQAYWQEFGRWQQRLVDRVNGHDLVTVQGPNADLSLSVRGRSFFNSCGIHNLPDGEIYTGPVESSVNGWVRFTYPGMFAGRSVEGIELVFRDGQVVEARAEKNEALLNEMLATDAGARSVGEFAIGTNFEIKRFTRNILFDEKIGGTFHLALGQSYAETGGQNKSGIHWDLICDLREGEIRVDGEPLMQLGRLVEG
jgi:aminopeptidase